MKPFVEVLAEEWEFYKNMIPKGARDRKDHIVAIAYLLPIVNFLNEQFKQPNKVDDSLDYLIINQEIRYQPKINSLNQENGMKEYWNVIQQLNWINYLNNKKKEIELTDKGLKILQSYNVKNYETEEIIRKEEPVLKTA